MFIPLLFLESFSRIERGYYLVIIYLLFSQSLFIISLNNIRGNNNINKTTLTKLFSILIIIYYTSNKYLLKNP